MSEHQRSRWRERLNTEISGTENFFCSLFDGDCPSWTKILFVEDIFTYLDKGIYRLPTSELLTKEQYEPKFESMLTVCTWINFQAIGIVDETLLIAVEYPRQRVKHGKNDLVSVNPSGPYSKMLGTGVAESGQLDWRLDGKVIFV